MEKLIKKRRLKMSHYPQGQRVILSFLFLAGSMGCLGIFAGAALFLQKVLQVLQYSTTTMTVEAQTNISDLYLNFTIFAILFAIVYLGVLLLVGMVFISRIMGPLYRITTDLSKMIESNSFAPLKVRKNDLFYDMAQNLNSAIEKRSP